MFNRQLLGVSALLLLVFLSLFVRPVRAASVPFPVVNPPTPALVTPSAWPVGTIGTSPTWGYSSTPVPAGAPVTVQPQVTVTSPWVPTATPSGTGVSIPVPQTYEVPSAAGAKPVASIPSAPSASVTGTVDAGPGGPSSTASGMAKKAFGVGAGVAVGTAAAKFIPYIGTAITVGQVGFALYDALKTDGLTVNADGSATVTTQTSGYKWGLGACPTTMSQGAFAACAIAYFNTFAGEFNAKAIYNSPSSTSIETFDKNGNSVGLRTFNGVLQPPTVTSNPATYDDVIRALDRVTASVNVAADAINFAMNKGVPIPDGLPLSYNVPTIKLTGIPNLTSSSTDTVGNTTNTFSQPSATVDLPTKTGLNPTITTGNITSTVTNNTTTNTVQTFNPVTVIPSAGTSLNTQLKQADLCVDHPDILACSNDANVGDVASQVLANKDIQVAITPVQVSEALCPAPITFVNGFGKVETWDIFGTACRNLSMFRPLILAFAWLAAAMIVVTGRLKNE